MLYASSSTLYLTLSYFIFQLLKFHLSSKQHFHLTEMGNKRDRRSSKAQSPSLENDLSASENETSQGNETNIETLSNFENVGSARKRETPLVNGSENEDEIQVWTQRITEKTNKEVSDLREEMNEKLEKILKAMKSSRKAQFVTNRRNQEQNTPQAATSKNKNTKDDEANASEPEDQENEIQDSPFRPSNMNEFKTPMKPLNLQNIDLNDSVVINEDRIGEYYHNIGVYNDF